MLCETHVPIPYVLSLHVFHVQVTFVPGATVNVAGVNRLFSTAMALGPEGGTGFGLLLTGPVELPPPPPPHPTRPRAAPSDAVAKARRKGPVAPRAERRICLTECSVRERGSTSIVAARSAYAPPVVSSTLATC